MLRTYVIAALLDLVGTVFVLQGLGVLPGSPMTGDPTWVVVGGAMVLGAAWMIWSSYRRRTH